METQTEAVQNYLKTIYSLNQTGPGATTQEMALRLGVSAPGVTKMLKHLAKHRMVDYTPYQPVRLTALGERIALEVIRHHRLLEVYLVESLGYGWDRVHAEAERLEHHISEDFEDTIDRLLGYPTVDPHGDPIPTRDGRMPRPILSTLFDQPDGVWLRVRRVTDEDDALLRYFGERSLRPGVQTRVLEREPYGGSLHLEIAGIRTRISPQAARQVFVELVSEEAAHAG